MAGRVKIMIMIVDYNWAFLSYLAFVNVFNYV